MLKSEIHTAKAHGGSVDFLSTCNSLKPVSSAICIGWRQQVPEALILLHKAFSQQQNWKIQGLWGSIFKGETELDVKRDKGFRHHIAYLSKIKVQQLSVRLPLSVLMVMQIKDFLLGPAELGISPHSQWISPFAKGIVSFRKCHSVFWAPRQMQEPFFSTSRFLLWLQL